MHCDFTARQDLWFESVFNSFAFFVNILNFENSLLFYIGFTQTGHPSDVWISNPRILSNCRMSQAIMGVVVHTYLKTIKFKKISRCPMMHHNKSSSIKNNHQKPFMCVLSFLTFLSFFFTEKQSYVWNPIMASFHGWTYIYGAIKYTLLFMPLMMSGVVVQWLKTHTSHSED